MIPETLRRLFKENKQFEPEAVESAVLDKAIKSTVSLLYRDEAGKIQSRFTGVHVGGGRMLTVRHGIEDIESGWKLESQDFQGKINQAVTVIAQSSKLDLAMLHSPDADNLPVAEIAANSKIKSGHTLFIVSYTEDRANAFRIKYLRDYDSSFVFEDHVDPEAILCMVKPGSSGSGIFNQSGELNGILYSQFRGNTHLAINSAGIWDFYRKSKQATGEPVF